MVIGIVVTIAAIAIPNIDALFSDARLDASADMIRARLADARSMAMEQNQPIRFGFVSGSGKFQIAPDASNVWNSGATSGVVEEDDRMTGELLEGIVFGTDARSVSGASGSSSSGTWQVGGVFLPDGSARGPVNPDGTSSDDVTFYYGTAGSSPMAVHLRGVTGTARIYDPSTTENTEP
jgi:Tfp pilus assembly protein FimT